MESDRELNKGFCLWEITAVEERWQRPYERTKRKLFSLAEDTKKDNLEEVNLDLIL